MTAVATNGAGAACEPSTSATNATSLQHFATLTNLEAGFGVEVSAPEGVERDRVTDSADFSLLDNSDLVGVLAGVDDFDRLFAR